MPDLKWRLLISVLVLVTYFLLLRPIRAQINENLFTPFLEQNIRTSSLGITIAEGSSVSNLLIWQSLSEQKKLYIKVPFGLNFLIGLIGLVMVGTTKQYYGILTAIQLMGGLLSLFFFYLGTVSAVNFLIVTDLIGRYLIPLCSLGVVPLAFIQKKQVYEGQTYRTS